MKKHVKATIVVLMLFLAKSAESQYTLDNGSSIMINNQNGNFTASAENELLQCGTPGESDLISYIDCGFGSEMGPDGKCYADANSYFEIDYGLNGASTCTGELGTPDWRGSHPIGIGTGDFSYPITGGIDEEVLYRLTCEGQLTTVQKFKGIAHRGVIDLTNTLKSGVAHAMLKDQMWKFDLITTQPNKIPLNHEFDKESINQVKFMIRQIHDQIYSIPLVQDTDVELNFMIKELDPKYSTYMKVSHIQPTGKMNVITHGKAPGMCDSLSNTNQSAINISLVNNGEGCFVDIENQAFLVWYILEKKDEN